MSVLCAFVSFAAACELAELEAEISEAEVDELYLCLCEESCALESVWLERLQRLKISSYIIHEAAVDLKRRLAFYRASEEILEPKLLARPRFYGLPDINQRRALAGNIPEEAEIRRENATDCHDELNDDNRL